MSRVTQLFKRIWSRICGLRWWAKAGYLLLLMLFTLLFFGNVFVRNYINSNGEALLGRKVVVEKVHLNYLTCSITLKGLKIYETNRKTLFLDLSSGYINLNPWALLNGHYEASDVELDGMHLRMVQNEETFNFSDLFESKGDDKDKPTRYTFANIKIKNSYFTYIDNTRNNTYPLKNLNIEIPELSWNNTSSSADIRFTLGEKGRAQIDAKIDRRKNLYVLTINSSAIPMHYCTSYVRDLITIEQLKGTLDSQIEINGSLVAATDIFFKGSLTLHDFYSEDVDGNEFVEAKRVYIATDSLNIQQGYYAFEQIHIYSPFIRYDIRKKQSNFERALALSVERDRVTTEQNSGDTTETADDQVEWIIKDLYCSNGTIFYTDDKLFGMPNYTFRNTEAKIHDMTHDGTNVLVNYSFDTRRGKNIKGEFRMNILEGKNSDFNTNARDIAQLIIPSLSFKKIPGHGLFN